MNNQLPVTSYQLLVVTSTLLLAGADGGRVHGPITVYLGLSRMYPTDIIVTT